MTLRHLSLTTILVLNLAFCSVQAFASSKSFLDTLGIQAYSGAKLSSSASLAGPMLLDVESEFSGSLPVSNLKEIGIATYSVDSSVDASDLLKFYESAFNNQKWKTLVSTADISGEATLILASETTGLLILALDPSETQKRELTFVLAAGSVDTSKIDRRSAEKAGSFFSNKLKPFIPIGKPIPVAPSERLVVQSTKSTFSARFASRDSVQLNTSARIKSGGELTRTPEKTLVFNLTPKLDVDELLLPGNAPVAIELTDGGLTITGGVGSIDKPVKLEVTSTGAPVNFDGFPLLAGTHSVKVVGKSVNVALSQVQGGTLSIEVQSGNITLDLPQKASAEIDGSVLSGKIQNTATKDEPNGDSFNCKIGDGKARISLKTTNGNIIIKMAD